jgi:hypothetical protein
LRRPAWGKNIGASCSVQAIHIPNDVKLRYENSMGNDTKKPLSEIFLFARQNKFYLIVPLVLVLLLALLVIFGSQSSAPFIYTLF